MALINVSTKQEFKDKVLSSKKVVLVDFWAAWCPPCRAMAPILEKLADSMDAEVDVVKVDVEASEDNNNLAAEYGVQGIPNMHIIRGGKSVDNIVGMVPENLLRTKLADAAKA